MNVAPTNLARHIHTLEVIALLIPFTALSIAVLLATFGVAWRGKR